MYNLTLNIAIEADQVKQKHFIKVRIRHHHRSLPKSNPPAQIFTTESQKNYKRGLTLIGKRFTLIAGRLPTHKWRLTIRGMYQFATAHDLTEHCLP